MSKLFVQSTEMSDTKFVTTRARRRCGEIPGQERHSGRAAKRITYFVKVSNEKKMFYKGGKEYGPNGQTQGALTGRHHFVMASVSQASRNYINFAKL